MKRIIKFILLFVLSVLLLFNCDTKSTTEPEENNNSTITIKVEGDANIWAAGHSTLPPPSNNLAGDFPSVMNLDSVVHRPLTFSKITGTVKGRSSGDGNGADGKVEGTGTNITALQGISGIQHETKVMFLVGVFLDDNEPIDPAPDAINFSEAEHFIDIHPCLRQVFFIGDGRTGENQGDTQEFYIPEGATRLFLGFADAYNFTGAPGFYNDNTGELSVIVNL